MLIDVAGVLPFIDLLDVLFRISMESQQHLGKVWGCCEFVDMTGRALSGF